jgi:hypothetical protein
MNTHTHQNLFPGLDGCRWFDPAVIMIVPEKLRFSIGENTKVMKKQHQDLHVERQGMHGDYEQATRRFLEPW